MNLIFLCPSKFTFLYDKKVALFEFDYSIL